MASKSGSKTLEQTFKDTIDSATNRLKKYKADVNSFKGLVTEQTVRLQTLLQRLRDCIEKLKALRNSYNEYNQRIIKVRQRITVLLAEARSEGSTKAGEECNEKIKGLIEKFSQLNAEIGDFDGDGAGLRKGLDDLSSIIKELCDETKGILGTMGSTQNSINEEITGLENDVGAAAEAAATKGDDGSGSGESKSRTIPAPGNAGEKKMAGDAEEEEEEETQESIEKSFPSYSEFEAAFLGEATRLKQIHPKYGLPSGPGSPDRVAIRQGLMIWMKNNSKGMTKDDNPMFENTFTKNEWFGKQMRKVIAVRGGKKTRKRKGGWRDAEKNSPHRSLTMKIEKKKKKKKKNKSKKRKKLKIKKSRKKGKKK
jgi:predicted  nucleic acid-binding Zn-ribbon protein